jgi:hypothetical protein
MTKLSSDAANAPPAKTAVAVAAAINPVRIPCMLLSRPWLKGEFATEAARIGMSQMKMPRAPQEH